MTDTGLNAHHRLASSCAEKRMSCSHLVATTHYYRILIFTRVDLQHDRQVRSASFALQDSEKAFTTLQFFTHSQPKTLVISHLISQHVAGGKRTERKTTMFTKQAGNASSLSHSCLC